MEDGRAPPPGVGPARRGGGQEGRRQPRQEAWLSLPPALSSGRDPPPLRPAVTRGTRPPRLHGGQGRGLAPGVGAWPPGHSGHSLQLRRGVPQLGGGTGARRWPLAPSGVQSVPTLDTGGSNVCRPVGGGQGQQGEGPVGPQRAALGPASAASTCRAPRPRKGVPPAGVPSPRTRRCVEMHLSRRPCGLLGPPSTLRKGRSRPRGGPPCPGRRDRPQTGSGLCRSGLWASGWGPRPQPCPVPWPQAVRPQSTQSSRWRVGEGAACTARHHQGRRWQGQGEQGTAQVWGETRRPCRPWFCPQKVLRVSMLPPPPGCWVHTGLGRGTRSPAQPGQRDPQHSW